jgi:hypothetical protein
MQGANRQVQKCVGQSSLGEYLMSPIYLDQQLKGPINAN